MKKYDVVALGELLVDFTDNGLSGDNHNGVITHLEPTSWNVKSSGP